MITPEQAVREVNKAFPHLATLYVLPFDSFDNAIKVRTYEAEHNFLSYAAVYHDGAQIVVEY